MHVAESTLMSVRLVGQVGRTLISFVLMPEILSLCQTGSYVSGRSLILDMLIVDVLCECTGVQFLYCKEREKPFSTSHPQLNILSLTIIHYPAKI